MSNAATNAATVRGWVMGHVHPFYYNGCNLECNVSPETTSWRVGHVVNDIEAYAEPSDSCSLLRIARHC